MSTYLKKENRVKKILLGMIFLAQLSGSVPLNASGIRKKAKVALCVIIPAYLLNFGVGILCDVLIEKQNTTYQAVASNVTLPEVAGCKYVLLEECPPEIQNPESCENYLGDNNYVIIEKCTERYPLQNGIFFTSFISRYVQFGAAIAAGLFYGDPKN